MRLGARSMFKGFFVIISRSSRRQQKKENPDIPRVGIFYLLKPSIILNLRLRFLLYGGKDRQYFSNKQVFRAKKRKK